MIAYNVNPRQIMSTSAEASVDIIISGLHYMLSPSMGSDIYIILPEHNCSKLITSVSLCKKIIEKIYKPITRM